MSGENYMACGRYSNNNQNDNDFDPSRNFLTPYQDADSVPPNAYHIYDMSGGKFYVLHKNYDSFVSALLNLVRTRRHYRHHLALDLNKAVVHAVCLDIDGFMSDTEIDYYVNCVLVPGLKDFFSNASFTVLVAQKQSLSPGGGLHVYLPDFKISNDDYEWLCHLLQSPLAFQFASGAVKLDFPRNFNLPLASKPDDEGGCYRPSTLVLVNEHDTVPITLRLSAADSNMDAVKKMLAKTPKKNALKHLAFLQYVNQIPQNRSIVLGRLMSPVNCCNALRIQPVSFGTTITEKCEDEDSSSSSTFQHCVATFEYMDQRLLMKYVYKDTQISFPSSSTNVHAYLKSQMFRITKLESSLYSINQWWNANVRKIHNNGVEEDIFYQLNLRLKRDNKSIREEDHPIRKILTYDNGKFFLPVFYALCNEINVEFRELCDSLQCLLGDDHALLNRLRKFNDQLVANLTDRYTYQTILYCTGNMHPPVNDLMSKVKIIVENEAADIEKNVSSERVILLMCHILSIYFPIYRTDKDKKFIWNPVHGKWMAVNREDDVRCILVTITDCLITYYKQRFNCACPFKSVEIRDKCYSTITSKNFMENIPLTLDFRYWLVRTNEGCLDVLTMNVSAIVPEHYLSEKTFLPKFHNISGYLGDAQLRQTYRQLWDRSFFEEYVRRLKSEESDDTDYLLVLRQMTLPGTDALLHAYTHLCKYLKFNFEEIRYFLHVLATTMISTNYGKQFFILQGIRNNGKSRLFVIFHTIFGQYLGVVDNETLSVSRKSELKPEIVKYIYTCKLTTVEEFAGFINENFLKNLTGNCMLSARTLYETNCVGIPTSKIIVATNKAPAIYVTEAFRGRIVVFNFSAQFVPNLVLSTAQQIEEGRFKVILDETIIKDTALGFFLHMSFFLEEHVSLEDGFLHYPDVPESLVKFKDEYLKITNIYFQFKMHMDIQVFPGEITSLSEVKSAIRHFLKATKNNMCIDEKEILDQFDAEFESHIFYPEEEMGLLSESDSQSDGDDEDDLFREPKAKKMKKAAAETTEVAEKNNKRDNLCYNDIVIKGLKKNYR